MAFEEEVRISFAAQAERMEEQRNGYRLQSYFDACANWGASYGRGDRPKIPTGVDSVVAFEPEFSVRFPETGNPLTDRHPEEWLPKQFLPTSGAEEIGAELKHAPWTFAFTGHGAYPNEGEVRTKDGVQYVFVRGFFGFGGFWRKK